MGERERGDVENERYWPKVSGEVARSGVSVRQLRKERSLKKVPNAAQLKEWWPALKLKLLGHYRYYGVSGNYPALRRYYTLASKLAYKWINRRSQKKSYTFAKYLRFLAFDPLPKPRIYRSLYTLSPLRGGVTEEPRLWLSTIYPDISSFHQVGAKLRNEAFGDPASRVGASGTVRRASRRTPCPLNYLTTISGGNPHVRFCEGH
jgi:hypothetical protein